MAVEVLSPERVEVPTLQKKRGGGTRVPPVELHVDAPTLGKQGTQGFQHAARDAVLAAKWDTLPG